MNNSIQKTIAIAAFAGVAIAAAIGVRLHYQAEYKRSTQAYKIYLQRQALQNQAEAEARSNEQRVARLKSDVAAHPNNVRARWALAGELQKFRLLDDALLQLREIVRLDPNSELAAIAVANTELALHRLQEAEPAYRRITTRWPKSIEGWQGLAAALYQLRRFRDAGEAGRQALSLDQHDRGSQIIVASSALEFGLEYPDEHATRDPLQIARGLYTMLAKEDPANGQFQYQLGIAKFLLHDKTGSLPNLDKATKLLPDRANIAFDYAQILISTGKYAEARAFLTQASTRMPSTAGLYYLLAESYQYDSDPASIREAIRAGQKAVQLSPNTASYWDRLGAEYLKAQDIDHARLAFEKSLLLDANRSYPYQQLAGVYTRLGDAKRASVAAKMATRMVANDENMRHLEALSSQYPGAANLLLVRADRYRDLKMYGPARDLYEQAIIVEPGNVAAKRGVEAIDKLHMPGGAPK